MKRFCNKIFPIGIAVLIIGTIALLTSCQKSYEEGTFGYDFQRLQNIEGIEILQDGKSMIAVSGPYQGKIFTSSSKGLSGKSYGWVNWKLIEEDQHAMNITYLGGESRIWFAPEFGPFSLFFKPGAEQVDANMRATADMKTKTFTEINRTKNALTFGGKMELENAADYVFHVDIERTISLLPKNEIEENLRIQLSDPISYVGFSAETTVKNIGSETFKKENGLIALWELGCMLTSPDNWVIIPIQESDETITEYFTPIGNRAEIRNNMVFYKADALGLNKIGIPPSFCKNIMGSYSPSNDQLNIVSFNFEHDSIYVNSLPKNITPYEGDVINIFNGEVNEQLGRNWPFYEFESSSSAKELKSGENMYHKQTTYHFEGKKEALDQISQQVLGISLYEIPNQTVQNIVWEQFY